MPTLEINTLESLETALIKIEAYTTTLAAQVGDYSEWAAYTGTKVGNDLITVFGDTTTITINEALNTVVSTGQVAAPSYKLDLAAAYTVAQGEIAWNADEETIDIGLNGAVLQAGQEVHFHVRNSSGVQIDNGKPVMSTGTIGGSGRITIDLMNNDGTTESHYFLGIATEDITDGTDGKVTQFGKIRGIQTNGANYGETWIDGDLLYLNPNVVGALTNVRPTTGSLIVPVAIVINSHASNGTLFIRVTIQDPPRLVEYTVATLPVTATQGDTAYVTDATAPTYLGALTGGGAIVCPVFYNGSAWVSA